MEKLKELQTQENTEVFQEIGIAEELKAKVISASEMKEVLGI